jgi:polyisoprenoid-binding protein YceI
LIAVLKGLLAGAIASLLLAQAPSPRSIDVAKSTARFSISHIWVESVAGTVPILEGAVVLQPGSSIPTSVTATLDATRIDTGEPDRDHSLESPDFFDVKEFPHWTFSSTKIVPTGSGALAMDGNLTIHGVTRPEHLQVTVSGTAARPEYHASGRIDRHAFGMPRTRLDPVIGDDADVTLDVILQ